MAYRLPDIAVTGTAITATWGNAVRESLQYFKGTGGQIEVEAAFRLPSYTSSQRNSLSGIDPGAMIYNSSAGVVQYRGAAAWEGRRQVALTAAQYQALSTKDPDTVYLVDVS
ncbi:MAG: hypothetical protein OXG72_02605 [Acidobacteria bacterium]|nr:hypothetical protein [Acidobacteriota bacterium]